MSFPGASGGSSHDDVWDDSVLVDAFNTAVQQYLGKEKLEPQQFRSGNKGNNKNQRKNQKRKELERDSTTGKEEEGESYGQRTEAAVRREDGEKEEGEAHSKKRKEDHIEPQQQQWSDPTQTNEGYSQQYTQQYYGQQWPDAQQQQQGYWQQPQPVAPFTTATAAAPYYPAYHPGAPPPPAPYYQHPYPAHQPQYPSPYMAPPAPPQPPALPPQVQADEALAQLIMSWYYTGYFTGHYQALQKK